LHLIVFEQPAEMLFINGLISEGRRTRFDPTAFLSPESTSRKECRRKSDGFRRMPISLYCTSCSRVSVSMDAWKTILQDAELTPGPEFRKIRKPPTPHTLDEFRDRDVLDAMKEHIAVLDRNGVVVAVNRAWVRYAEENGAGASIWGEGASYVQVCRRAAVSGELYAAQAAEGIQEVLGGWLEVFELEYPCHSPVRKQWFRMQVIPIGDPLRGVLVSHADITLQKETEEELKGLLENLKRAIQEVKTLRGLLPICASCKRIRDDQGYWRTLEQYLKEHTCADFSHSMCPSCVRRLYPEWAGKRGRNTCIESSRS